MNTRETGRGILWLKLEEASRQTLQAHFPPKYPTTYYDHVTLAFGTNQELVRGLIGITATVRAYAYASNTEIEAVRVQTNGLPDTYGVPHITLSAQPGVEPFKSVAMLQGEHGEVPISPNLKLFGVIEFIPL